MPNITEILSKLQNLTELGEKIDLIELESKKTLLIMFQILTGFEICRGDI